MKTIVVLLATVTAVLGFGLATNAQDPDPPFSIGVRLPPPSMPGETFFIDVHGCEPGEQVQVEFAGEMSTVTADDEGYALVTLVAPAEPGRYNGVISCQAGSGDFGVLILAPAEPDPPDEGDPDLPETGLDATSTTLLAAFGLLAAGFALVAVSRRSPVMR